MGLHQNIHFDTAHLSAIRFRYSILTWFYNTKVYNLICKPNKSRCKFGNLAQFCLAIWLSNSCNFYLSDYLLVNADSKHLRRYVSSSSNLRPSQRRSESELPPPPPEEMGTGCPLMSASATAKIILRTEGIAKCPSNVLSSDSNFSFASGRILFSRLN